MNKILVIIHQVTSDPGLVGQILHRYGYTLDIRCPSNNDPLPLTMDDHKAVVIFGGPMSANDDETLPFIKTELDWIPVALASGKPYLGICLGAQLLARVLGATVKPHPEEKVEIGYFPIMPTSAGRKDFAEPLYVYHWHNEGWELPAGAVSLATGETFVNQAFRYGENAVGVQFHPEMTEEMLKKWTVLGAEHLSNPGAQSRDEQLQNHAVYAIAMEKWLTDFLHCWLQQEASLAG
ncbi:MAG: glutamine amidotransferase [Kastovskya adunca ATA6-11-RM4]|nr:glutamine amidotransferase [Kastovskya adunca ATA6-11-RM4]